jgi:uncharacterized protein (DUF1015 family)
MSASGERIEPFTALMFNRSRCGALAEVAAPPYDLIDKARQDALYARSQYNIVRLELNRDDDPYASAAETLALWLREGIVERAAHPSIYFYTQSFELEGRRLVRNGLIARIRLEEFSAGRILPHERTFPAAKEDRLRLLIATGTNVSPIFGLYPSGNTQLEGLLTRVAGRAPMLDVADDAGIVNQIRSIDMPAEIRIVQGALAEARVLIADGHHRYETALEYRRRTRSAAGNPGTMMPYDYVMMTLVAFNDPGLVILPTHRLIRRLDRDAIMSFAARARELFEIEEFENGDAMRAALSVRGRGALGIALTGERSTRLLHLKNYDALASIVPDVPKEVRELDVSILHTLVLDRIFGLRPDEVRKGGNIEYTIDARAALAAVERGEADGAFLMNPPSVHDVERVCGAGATMPEKSTYFYPKLLTGLVMNQLDR